MVAQSGGHIDVRSAPGQGTTFSIYLPRVTEAAHAPTEPESEGVPGTSSETILLVDDMETVRSLARRCLEEAGYHVMEASHGAEALTLSARHKEPIHLLLTDVVMPQMNGPELADRLVRAHPETKVLYMSGYTDDVLFQQGKPEWRAHLLHKPVSPTTLIRKVHELLDVSR